MVGRRGSSRYQAMRFNDRRVLDRRVLLRGSIALGLAVP
ncbi:MAG: hypothetical protein K0Q71_2221, partial [Thermomicrobiales bacterium]|nr:hypothetical protein [Thermomicrobiales bacterium]